MNFSAKLTLLICAAISCFINCSLGENISRKKDTPLLPVLNENALFDVNKIDLPYSFDEDTSVIAKNLYKTGLSIFSPSAKRFAFQEAIRLKPDYAEAYVQLGFLRQSPDW